MSTIAMEITTRSRREKQPEVREAVEQFLTITRCIEATEWSDILDELLEYVQDTWSSDQGPCDIDEYDIARALRKLHSVGTVRVQHRDAFTDEPRHFVRISNMHR